MLVLNHNNFTWYKRYVFGYSVVGTKVDFIAFYDYAEYFDEGNLLFLLLNLINLNNII